MKIDILGTSGSIVTQSRDPVSILVNDSILIDCAEGTTKKLLNLTKLRSIKAILISHVHPDHFAGFLTLVWRFWLGEQRTRPLDVHGPVGIRSAIETLFEITKTPIDSFGYVIKYHEIDGKKIEKNGSISALKVRHSIPTLAFRLDLDKSICYSGDTQPFNGLVELAQGCDVLIHETSGPAKQVEWLHKYGHSCSLDAARIARDAHARMLIPIHFLPHVRDPEKEMREEIESVYDGKIIFPNDGQSIII
ncbi:MAG: MBL fold metallo-hydrolase [Candidatus Helarchaeota archaeon]